jgi:pimeloyl-ACP methyl ester carboxylesterase
MPRAAANGIDIEYDTFGDRNRSPLLLIMGLSSQMVAWPESFCQKLAQSGHWVLRFDNRDVGLSSKIEGVGIPDLMAAMTAHQQGQPVAAPYTLSDMAADAIGLMDALELEKAHVCGLSMGGMIAQVMAIEYPRRISSLISMESSTGDPTLPPAKAQAMEAMLSPPPQDRDGYIHHAVEVFRAFSGGSDKFDETLERELAVNSYDRSFYPVGFIRQLAAILASGDRSERLASVTAPTLVIHGANDPLVTLAHGRATGRAIPGAKLLVIEGLGHGIAYPTLWDEIVDAITQHTSVAPGLKSGQFTRNRN